MKPKVKGRVHTDEIYVKVKGKGYYSINSVDSKTKYNLATTFTKHRSKQKCRAHFKKLKNKIGFNYHFYRMAILRGIMRISNREVIS